MLLDGLAHWRFKRALTRLETAPSAALRRYAQADWPPRSARPAEVGFLALDFELDGLGADAHLLQAGWIPFTLAAIPLAGAQSRDIRSARRLDDKAVIIHGIGEQRARQGGALAEVMEELLEALAGRVVIAHGAAIERAVLSRASRAVFDAPLPVRSICTMALQQKLNPQQIGTEPYRLASARAHYGLPPHALHDALGDALAAAELFLAQAARLPQETGLGALEDLAVGH